MDRPFNITRTTVILNKDRAIRNIERMARKARQSGVRFRPHFKTHQSAQVGEWFKNYWVDAITVSSLDMAEYFAGHGWKDITIAFPVNWLQIGGINKLAKEITLNLLVESKETAQFLRENLHHKVDIWLNIDTGVKRTGVPWSSFGATSEIVKEIVESANLTFSGILTHSGHSYRAKSKAEVIEVYLDAIYKMNQVRDKLCIEGYSPVQLSIGDTPCCSLVDDLSEADEIRPGTFVFYDLRQQSIGSCTEEEIAIAVACPVVAKYEERNEIVIYGGAAHLSRDFILGRNGEEVFGYIARFTQTGWGPLIENTYVSHLSQEFGIVKASHELCGDVRVSDILAVLPVHSCLTVNLMRKYITLDGNEIECADFLNLVKAPLA